MIFTLIILLLIIIFLAFFVGKNLGNTCTLWIFKTYTQLPVATLVFISFAAGIVISILCLIIFKLKRNETETKQDMVKAELKKIEKKNKKIKLKELKLNKPKSEETKD